MSSAEPTTATPAEDLQPRTMRKVAVRLIPVLLVLYVIAYLDRVNVTVLALILVGGSVLATRVAHGRELERAPRDERRFTRDDATAPARRTQPVG
jgi:hypothetical protein